MMGFLAGDAPDELFERVGVGLAEVDPLEALEEEGEFRGLGGVWEEDGDDGAVAVDELADQGFFDEALPFFDAGVADEDRG